jgi:hypothetical protein
MIVGRFKTVVDGCDCGEALKVSVNEITKMNHESQVQLVVVLDTITEFLR